jgi:hypothetical protein
MIEVGDRVKVIKMLRGSGFNYGHKKELIQKLSKYPVEVVRTHNFNGKKRYQIEIYGVLNTQGTNFIKWVDEDDITLDLEYYRNLKIENILDESSLCE